MLPEAVVVVDCHRLELRVLLDRRDNATVAHLAQDDVVKLERETLENRSKDDGVICIRGKRIEGQV